GKQLTDDPNPDTLSRAIADSGVDVTGLVNAGTLTAPFAGGVTGDPHLVTAGGTRVSTQLRGQFVARADDPTHRIQLEFSPMAHRDDVSIVSEIAIGTGPDTVIAGASGTVAVND